MAELTSHEIDTWVETRIKNRPDDFYSFSPDERWKWVEAELNRGDYRTEKALEIGDILTLGKYSDPSLPEYFMYRILLSKFDPADTAARITKELSVRMFIDAYGWERSKPFFSDSNWFRAFKFNFYIVETRTTTPQIKLLLQSRGMDKIADLVSAAEDSRAFIDIFGVEALDSLPKDIARKIRGHHLEDQLGL